MSDPVTGSISISDFVTGVAFAFLGLVSWNGKRLVNKVDKLEAKLVDKDEYNNTISSLRKEIKDGNRQTQELIIGLHNGTNGKG